ncbi:ATP-binding protein [Atopobiaceae bacterium 24-176]
MADSFYPFVENGPQEEPAAPQAAMEVHSPARVAVYDDAAAAPRVVVVEPTDVRAYLEEITATVSRLAKEQGGSIPFTVIRECVENLIHAYFTAPTISILDGGDTIRFSDQGPGIADKRLALEYGTSSATEEMKRYIRGVGSGLPYASQYMEDKGGTLTIEDNIQGGCVVTISLVADDAPCPAQAQPAPWPAQAPQAQPMAQAPALYGMQQPYPAAPAYGQPAGYPPAYPGVYQQPAAPAYGAPYPGAPAGAYPTQAPQGVPAAAPACPLNSRQLQALQHIVSTGSGRSSELAAVYEGSAPTWSRALMALAEAGFATKSGQRYAPTAAGIAYLSSLPR